MKSPNAATVNGSGAMPLSRRRWIKSESASALFRTSFSLVTTGPGVPAGATGRFIVTTVEPKTGKVKLTWKLTFSHLSGKAMQAHIHLGKPGKAGNVLVALCAPCKNGQTGKTTIARSIENDLEAGKTYVNVHTQKNPAGEIRGQIKVKSS